MAAIHRNSARITPHPRDPPWRQGLTLLRAAVIRLPRVPIVGRAEVPAAVAVLTAAVEVELRTAAVAVVLLMAVVEAVLLMAAVAALTVTVSRF